jgi:dienelactone hydrolase
MRKTLAVLSLTLLISSIGGLASQAYGTVVEKGKINKKVICLNEPAESYALYLPLAYTHEKKWPILYALDPGARGSLPLEQYEAAAEKYNYIVAGSNNARNGPWEPVVRSITAIWDDTNARLSVDQKRIYVTGFSGGSRAASLFSKIIGRPVAGIIGCGAGLAPELKPEEIAPAFYSGVVGLEDFNYDEMMSLDKRFEKHNISHRFFVFNGPHAWPPQDVCMRVIEWMEIIGMSKRVRPAEEKLIKEIYDKELAKAETLEASGQIIQALSDYEAIASTFKEWQVTDAIETKIENIKKNKDYTHLVKNDKKRRDKELSQKSKFRRILIQIKNDESAYWNLNKILSNLGINGLLREASKKKNLNDSALDIRILHRLELDASGIGWDHLQKNDHKRAILFFEIAARAGIKSHRRLYSYYGLACAYSLSKNSKQALKNLKLAVENGFNDIASLKEDERLKFIRKTPEFQEILETLEKKQTPY